MFVVRLVALLALFAVACAQGQCGNYATYGKVTNLKIQLKDTIMRPGEWDWTFNFPSDTSDICRLYYPSTVHVGSMIHPCDYDSPPIAELDNLMHGGVHRTGRAEREGVIQSWLFCDYGNYYGSSEKENVVKGVQGRSSRVSSVQISAPDSVSRI